MAPPHKSQDYNRLAHHFGFVNKRLFKLCSTEAPWGPEGRTLEEMVNDNQDLETPTWSINPSLPKGISKIFIEETMVPADVQAIGQTYGDKADWIGPVVQFACTVQGKVHGPLGPDLVMATANLIAEGLHTHVSKNDLGANHPAAPPPAAPPPAAP